jgi:hypothetical protein
MVVWIAGLGIMQSKKAWHFTSPIFGANTNTFGEI